MWHLSPVGVARVLATAPPHNFQASSPSILPEPRWQGISIRGPSHLPAIIDMAAKTALVTHILISIQHVTGAGIALCLDSYVHLSQLAF